VTTARRTRLVRTSNLRSFRHALTLLSLQGDPAAIRQRAVIVPGAGAADHLRRALEDSCPLDRRAVVIPDLVTREGWLGRLCELLPGPVSPLTGLEREVLLQAAARDAISGGNAPPFRLRPGLVAEMLVFYDALRRQMKTVDDFERLVVGDLLRAVDLDRGAVRLLAQTRFLVEAFAGYERRMREGRLADEHLLRDELLASTGHPVYRHVIVAVGDRIGDTAGLWPCDFDLLARLHGVERVDIVSTVATFDAGFGDRVEQRLPGIEVVSEVPKEEDRARPRLVVPPAVNGSSFRVYRDREDELAGIARAVKAAGRTGSGPDLSRTAVVFKRPLPYVYLARQLFPAAGIPYQTFDALPLAAEPYAAALEQVFAVVESGFTRSTIIALLRCPHFRFGPSERSVSPEGVAALDRALSESRYLGDPAELASLAERWASDTPEGARGDRRAIVDAGRAAADAAAELAVLAEPDRPSDQLGAVLSFLRLHERVSESAGVWRERYLRARGAILEALQGLQDACLRHDDRPAPFSDLAATVRRWIESRTFAPRAGAAGLHLLDTQTARFGDFDALYVVGVIQREWPEAQRPNIFYPASLVRDLGWPQEPDAAAAARAAFHDLLDLPRVSVSISTFTLEDDAIVESSALLEDLSQLGLEQVEDTGRAEGRIFSAEAMTLDPVRRDALDDTARAWLDLRISREPPAEGRFHGQSDPPPARAYKVSALDQYRDCPFKYFSAEVLRLKEEPEDEDAMSPKLRGKFVHEVLQQFFEEWQLTGHGAITVDGLDEARTLFASVVESLLPQLTGSEAAIERARLLGSPVASGIGEIVFRAEVERATPVVERLLEYTLDGDAVFRSEASERHVAVRAKADRIDLLADGTFRLIDYKLTRAPKPGEAVQLPAYAAAAQARLDGYRGRHWRPSEAAYVAFGADRRYVPVASRADQLDAALAAGEARLLQAVDRIERGRFPPAPADQRLCRYCPFSGVCRKEYVVDE
jgi:RecB family exonuclease